MILAPGPASAAEIGGVVALCILARVDQADGPPLGASDPLELAEWILTAARESEGRGGLEAIALAAASIPAARPAALVEQARLLAVGAYFDGRGDGTSGAASRLARARDALVKARGPLAPARSFAPIGRIRSPWTSPLGMPLQTIAAKGVAGRVELRDEFAPAVRDLAGFSHVWVLSDLDRARGYELEVVPFLDDQLRSLFATRSPRRPNPIGLSLLRVIGVEGATILVEELDLLDETPVLDLKPYVPLFDSRETTAIGWFDEAAERVFEICSDDRFHRTEEETSRDSEPCA